MQIGSITEDLETAILYGKSSFPGLGWMQLARLKDFMADCGLLIGLHGKTS